MAFPNTIASGLQRQAFMDSLMREFKYRILPVTRFSTIFRDVPLQGTDKMDIPFYPLTTAASKDFDKTVGYDVSGASTTGVVEVTINKRKYQPLSWNSQDFRRQPNLRTEQLAIMVAEKLAQDVLNDIFSAITAANFGASPFAAITAPTAYNWGNAMDMKNACDVAMWPAAPRALILDSAYANNLCRDPLVSAAYAYGSAGGVAEGMRGRVADFDLVSVPLLPTNGEKLVGMAAYPTALVIGFAPIRPTPEVERMLTEYRAVTDPEGSGLTIEYRMWGDPLGDRTNETFEVNYGYNMGQASALKRLVSV